MSTQTLDFSDLGGRRVQGAAAQGIDFSDLGGRKIEQAMPNAGLSGAARPNVKMHEASLVTGKPNESFDEAPSNALGELKQALEGTAASISQVSAPGIAASLLHKFAPSVQLPHAKGYESTPLAQLPGQIITTGLMGMEEGLGRPNRAFTTKLVKPTAPPTEAATLTPEHVAALDKANAPYVKQVAADALAAEQATIADRIQQSTTALHDQVRGTLNQRWEALRGRMGNATVPTQPIMGAIEQSQKMLAGVPDDLKIFKEITHAIDQGGMEATAERVTPEGLAPVEPGGLGFNDARIQASALGEKWAGASGNLRRALKNVYDAYNKTLQTTADSAGTGREYQALREDWHQYVEDWQGKGPLAKVRNAPHPAYVTPITTGRGSELLQQQLQRYLGGGVVAEDIAAMRDLTKQAKIPPLKIVQPPEPPAPKPGFIARHVPRVVGKAIGGAIGAKLGHPLIGYSLGGELGSEVGRKLSIPRTPEEYTRTILAAKEGAISAGEADRRIARGGGSVRVLRRPEEPTQ